MHGHYWTQHPHFIIDERNRVRESLGNLSHRLAIRDLKVVKNSDSNSGGDLIATVLLPDNVAHSLTEL